MKILNQDFRDLRDFLILWITQSFSSFGSALTSFTLVIWSYQQEGSALTTALLSVSSYAPYVLMSIFAGALSDKWDKKRTMFVSDSFAALTTLVALVLLRTGNLRIGHLYVLNALNGLMNTVQGPASTVAISMLVPKEHYQRVSGLQSFSNALVTVLTPVAASAMLMFFGLDAVILFDLFTCAIALIALAFFVRLPKQDGLETEKESVLVAARSGLQYLKQHRGILDLILFLACINLTASMSSAALPAMLLSRQNGGETAVGLVNTFTGLATLAGSILVSLRAAPKSRIRVICNSLLFSMATENFLLAFGRSTPVWCLAAVLGWIFIPVMSANMNVLFRSYIPIEMQGRVYSARNTLQFFTIPVGYLLGGVLVDRVLEPFMMALPAGSMLTRLLGAGKGSGAALLFLILGVLGVLTCLVFRCDKHIWALELEGDSKPVNM